MELQTLCQALSHDALWAFKPRTSAWYGIYDNVKRVAMQIDWLVVEEAELIDIAWETE